MTTSSVISYTILHTISYVVSYVLPVIIDSLQKVGKSVVGLIPAPQALALLFLDFVHCFVSPHAPLKHVQHSFPVTPRPMIFSGVTTVLSAYRLSNPV